MKQLLSSYCENHCGGILAHSTLQNPCKSVTLGSVSGCLEVNLQIIVLFHNPLGLNWMSQTITLPPAFLTVGPFLVDLPQIINFCNCYFHTFSFHSIFHSYACEQPAYFSTDLLAGGLNISIFYWCYVTRTYWESEFMLFKLSSKETVRNGSYLSFAYWTG